MTETTENRLPTTETTETAMPVSAQVQAAAAFIIEHNRKSCIKTLYQKYLKKVLVAASP